MRIVQLIDTLSAGGAERMAVNFANILAQKIEFSGLITTRAEGNLKGDVNENVSYLFLEKKSTLDLKAIIVLKKYVKANKIEVIHAHSTSYFLAFLVKLFCPKVKLIWHDHYGDSEFLSKRPSKILKIVVPFFSGIIAVNTKLKTWSEVRLRFKNVIYLPNFPDLDDEINETILKGNENKRIVCLANFREQKNHFLLLDCALKLREVHPDWSFHLIGKNFNDLYIIKLQQQLAAYQLEKNVYIYDTKKDIKNILKQASIGILTSKSEGLPLALLEYGYCKLPVVVTAVGEIPNMIINETNGLLVQSDNAALFTNALSLCIENNALSKKMAANLHQTILNNFSKETVINHYISWLKILYSAA